MTCSFDGCDRPPEVRGWCGLHYRRWLRHGDPAIAGHPPVRPPKVPLEDRFWPKVDVGHPLGCWLWTAGTIRSGYGQIDNLKAHRVAYEFLIGPIPDGLTLDHLCKERRCVNPDHLEPVTAGENALRGEGPPARNARKTHCIKGHEFSEENTFRHGNGRSRTCRTCQNEHKRRYRREGRVA